MWFDLWEAITFMLCLAPPIFSKRRTTIALQSSAVSFCSREKKEQNKNETKWLVFLFFDKFIKNYFFFSAVGGRHSLLWTFNFTIVHRRSVSKPSSTPQALDARLHTLLYKRKPKKKQKNMKIKVIAIDSCTACITFCTEKPSTTFFFFFLLININSEWFEFTASTMTVHVEWLRQDKREQSYFGYSLKREGVQQWVTIYHISKVSTRRRWRARVTGL